MNIKRIFADDEKCERQIKYNKNSLEFELSPNIPFIAHSMPIGKLKAEPKKIEEMLTYIKNLDYFQYEMCKMSKTIKNIEERTRIAKFRSAVLLKFIGFQIIIDVYQKNPEEHEDDIDRFLDELRDLSNLLYKQIVDESNKPSQIYDIKKLDAETERKVSDMVSKTESELPQLISQASNKSIIFSN
ncbi:MAG: hypothetical protein K0S93_109 [Nitrososphaeraceae archaeon]|jgi:hypothetical protein|nr:hypothetical protein [Nitrososphaeraceae archaeon]